ncbi:OmpW/AlkL family protein [Agitococcus lubricus]|uniref:Outer membrane protein n=1 Tax=Agitococcus lubricus TaxID=1077255 RepID=A0A2T5J409_9GAMM|nr:OmpW family outer membrane protein [Agitococcus lubricus]PTQ91350.1 outer membrane protein [Agitococcus lubricus]
MRTLVACLLSSFMVFPVLAQAESPWSVKIGGSYVIPKSNNGALAGGAVEADVSSELGLTPSIQYQFSPNIVGEVLLAIPFEHEVKDSLTGDKVATFKHLPPTFFAKYLLTPNEALSPYVGLGLNYTLVYDEELDGGGGKLKGDDSFGLAATAGVEYRPTNSSWGVALDIRYIKIKSDLTLDGKDIGSLTVDPLVVGVSAAYHY